MENVFSLDLERKKCTKCKSTKLNSVKQREVRNAISVNLGEFDFVYFCECLFEYVRSHFRCVFF